MLFAARRDAEHGFDLDRLGHVVPIQAEPSGCPADSLLRAGAEELSISVLNRPRVILPQGRRYLLMESNPKRGNRSSQTLGHLQDALGCGVHRLVRLRQYKYISHAGMGERVVHERRYK